MLFERSAKRWSAQPVNCLCRGKTHPDPAAMLVEIVVHSIIPFSVCNALIPYLVIEQANPCGCTASASSGNALPAADNQIAVQIK